jgi:hypothetical protein
VSNDPQDPLNNPIEKELQIRSVGAKTTVFGTLLGAVAAVPT